MQTNQTTTNKSQARIYNNIFLCFSETKLVFKHNIV